MKYPATLPTPSIRAAQALPSGCSDDGSVSTRSARSTACTGHDTMSARSLEHKTELTSINGEVNGEDSEYCEPDGKKVVL